MKTFGLLFFALRFSTAVIKSEYFSKVMFNKDTIEGLSADCGARKAIAKPRLFTSKSIMCAVFCKSIEANCRVTKYAGNDECYFIYSNAFSDEMPTMDLENPIKMHTNQPFIGANSSNPDIAAGKKIIAGSVESTGAPPETIVSGIQCYSKETSDLFCTTANDSFFTVDLGAKKNISTIRFWTAVTTKTDSQTLELADIHVGNNGTIQVDPGVKTDIFKGKQVNKNQKMDVVFDPRVEGRFISVASDARLCVQYFQVFSDPI